MHQLCHGEKPNVPICTSPHLSDHSTPNAVDISSSIKEVNAIHPFPPLSTIHVENHSQSSNANYVTAGTSTVATVTFVTLASVAIGTSQDDDKENIDFVVKTILNGEENKEVVEGINN